MKFSAIRNITIKPGHTVDFALTLEADPLNYTVPQSQIQAQLEGLATTNAASVLAYLTSKWMEPTPPVNSIWLLPGTGGSVIPFRISAINSQTRIITATAIYNPSDVRTLTPEQFAAANLKPVSDLATA